MTSMRTLNRRLTRWTRYARRTYWHPRVSQPAWLDRNTAMTPGHTRAWDAREAERERRACRAYDPYPGGECYCGGCAGAGPCDDDLARGNENACCLAGDDGHPGPCQVYCATCDGYGRCPLCGGEDDLGCHECGGTGSCPERCDDGVITEDAFWLGQPVVTVDTGGLT